MENIAERLDAVRGLMQGADIDAFIVPRADEYLGEYLPDYNERLRWISGFSGSAGVVIVLRDSAAIFVDGRYTVQVRQQVPEESFSILHLHDDPHAAWLSKQLPTGSRVGYDSRLHPLSWQRKTAATLEACGIELLALAQNPIDGCWQDRPSPTVRPALLLAQSFTGKASIDKRREIGAAISEADADAALIFAPDSIAWLLNIRGRDIPCMPVVLGFSILHADGRMLLLCDPAKLPEGFDAHVGDGVEVHLEREAGVAFAGLTGKRVQADPDTANAWCQLQLQDAGAELIAGADPVLMPKACKNAAESDGMRNAHIRDAVAEVQFLAWLDREVAAGVLHNEATLADRLLGCRQRQRHFQETSFDTISAAGANAAMCHYNHLNGEPAALGMNSVYLVDSGGQYLDGTTDITRTVAIGDPGDEARRMFTLVLKGHIALDVVRFPAGTTGTQLDVLARQFLWQQGFDYDHGTGHGVGCFLGVHEGPQRIGKAYNSAELKAGMVVSNEPGYYQDQGYGIRCENLVQVREFEASGNGGSMLGFEALTLVPFDQRLLDTGLMTAAELSWLNNYHARVLTVIGPLLDDEDRRWLEQATRPVAPARDAA